MPTIKGAPGDELLSMNDGVAFPVDDNNSGKWASFGTLKAGLVQAEEEVAETAHGRTVGQLIAVDGSGNYVLAQADDSATLAAAIISAVPNANTFRYRVAGLVSFPAHGKTVGAQLFLSETTPGAAIEGEPATGNWFQPIGIVKSASLWLVNIFAGVARFEP